MGTKRILARLTVATLLVLAGCAAPLEDVGSDTPTNNEGAPSRDLAVRASAVQSEDEESSGPSRPRKRAPARDGRAEKSSAPVDSQEPVAIAAARLLGSLSDPTGDAGGDAPGYADLTGVRIEDGGARIRVSVSMADRMLERLPDGEVEGVGIDLIRDGGEYQLFASGQPDGWFGYLYTPEGFVKYRGSLKVMDRNLIFTVPWSAVGGRGGGRFGAFVDWSGRGRVGRNPYSQDLAPESGTTSWND